MKHLLALLMLGLLFLNGLYAEEIEVSEDPVKSSFKLLTSKSFKDKTTAINLIADSGNPIATEVLSALLEGNVYYHKKNKDIVLIIESTPKNYDIKNPITDTILASKSI